MNTTEQTTKQCGTTMAEAEDLLCGIEVGTDVHGDTKTIEGTKEGIKEEIKEETVMHFVEMVRIVQLKGTKAMQLSTNIFRQKMLLRMIRIINLKKLEKTCYTAFMRIKSFSPKR